MMPTHPTRTPSARILTVLVVAALSAAVFIRYGLVVLILAGAVAGLIVRSSRRGRDLIMCAAAGMLALALVYGVPHLPAAPNPPAVTQDARVDQARDVWAQAWARVATLFSEQEHR